MCSAHRHMVFNICVKFMKICQAVLKLWSGHENCLKTLTHTHRKDKKLYTPMAYFVDRGYN